MSVLETLLLENSINYHTIGTFMIKNPTDKQLRTFKMIIYMFTNKINGKKYIGRTINKFIDRYVGCRWWENPSNKYLKNSIEKYGIENFEISILEYGVIDKEDLKRLEELYIKEYNCRYPNGYNYLPGGEDFSDTTLLSQLNAERLSKDYKFYDHKINKIIDVHNLSKFCRDNNLSSTMMSNVANGYYKKHKQYTLIDVLIKKWNLISPSGENFIVLEGELRPFCKKNNIHKSGISELCKGKISQYLGWICPDFKFPEKRIFKIKSPDGIVYDLIDGQVDDFCKKNNLSSGSIYSVLAGRTIHHKEWTLPETIVEYHEVINTDNEIIKIPKLEKCIAKFVKENNLKYDAFFHLFTGDVKCSQGWRIIK